MLKKYLILATAFLCGVMACTRQEDRSPKTVTFQAVMADAPATKSFIRQDGNIVWSGGDAISLFYGESGYTRLSWEGDTTSLASFSGTLDGFFPNGKDEFWAVYPYSSETTFNGSAVTLTLPDAQTAILGTFDNNTFVTMARTKDYTLQFYNLCGGVKFCVNEEGITQVIFRGNNNEVLAGTVKASFDDNGKPQVTEIIKGSTELKLTVSEYDFITSQWYYIVSLPASLSAGYTMTFLDASGQVKARRSVSTPVTIKRSVWGKLTDANDTDKDKFLTFRSEGTTTISLSHNNNTPPVLYYSFDKNTWTEWDYSDLSFTKGSPLYIYGDNPNGINSFLSDAACNMFVSSGDRFSVSGNIMSLIKSDSKLLTIPCDYCFAYLFNDCENLTDAPTLPATTLTNYCYANMFSYCYSMTAAPELPAAQLTEGCYYAMFQGCNVLSYVKCLATDISAANCVENWLDDVSSTGTFVKAPGMNDWGAGASGIPTDWYIQSF